MIRPVTTVSGSVAHLSLAAGALFLVLLVVLHILKPEYDPSWRMISEYEIGRLGWVMQLAFFFLALASLSALVAVWSGAKFDYRLSWASAAVDAATGMTIGGIFPSDPINDRPGRSFSKRQDACSWRDTRHSRDAGCCGTCQLGPNLT